MRICLIRLKLLALFSLCLFFLLLIRLYDLQVVKGMYFFNLANDNRFFELPLPAERGVFLDRYQQPLVHNKRSYFEIKDTEVLYSELQPINQKNALQNMASQSGSVAYQLYRDYVYGDTLAHVLGYTGQVTVEDLKQDSILEINDSIGKSGLEKFMDLKMRGVKGRQVFEINTMGIKQRLVEEQNVIPGNNIETTIDPFLSEVAYDSLQNFTGSVVIVDVDTGEVLSLVSSPSFDPNVFQNKYLDEQAAKQRNQIVTQYLTDPKKVFFNRATSGQYPLGSIFKLVVGLAGLETDEIDENTQVDDKGFIEVGDYQYTNWYYTKYGAGEGKIALKRAIARSNDVYFYKVAEWLGPNKIAEYARLFGFGHPTGIQVYNEASGLVPDPEWKEKEIGEKWFLGNTYHYGIGQGDLQVTPIQVAQMLQALSNDGDLCPVSLIKNSEESNCTNLGVKEENLDIIIQGMVQACNPGGTASRLFKFNQYYLVKEDQEIQDLNNDVVACKTGTAEFGGLNQKGFRKTHAWFVAIVNTRDLFKEANKDNSNSKYQQWLDLLEKKSLPDELVIVSMIESDDQEPYKEGSREAAAVVANILDWMVGNTSIKTDD